MDDFDSRFEDAEPSWAAKFITASITLGIFMLGVIAFAAICAIPVGGFVYFTSLEREREKFTENEAFIRGLLSGGIVFLVVLTLHTALRIRGVSRSR